MVLVVEGMRMRVGWVDEHDYGMIMIVIINGI